MIIKLSWPPAELSGHNTGHWRKKASIVKAHKNEAFYAVKELPRIILPEGDISTIVIFTPPDRKSDRLNYPNRMKPYFDGIAMALNINDSRFEIPTYIVAPPNKSKAGVTVEICNANRA